MTNEPIEHALLAHLNPEKPKKPAKPFPVSPIVGILFVVGAYFVSMLIGGFVVGVMPAFLGWSQARISGWLEESLSAQFLYVLSADLVMVTFLWIIMRQQKFTLRDIGLLRPRVMDFVISICAWLPYFVINAAVAAAAVALFQLDTDQRQQTGFENATGMTSLVITFISLVILPPIVEELIMRGFLFSSLKSGMKVIPAAVITSLIFAIAHLQIGSGAPALWLAAIDTFILSLVLCYLRQKTGSLWAGIGLHMLKNGLAFTVLFILPPSILN